ncbi:MAG TPA: sulfotransferase domain-containing protein [Pyrinomonadaceae bacterium]|nr:sulfotransferase domain-containing protein [Pyrinomonadaceae bacterium]
MKRLLKSFLPVPARRVLIGGTAAYRLATNTLRTGPDFIIIGGQRCGTTSLYEYLISHPNVVRASTKEIHFFDINFERGLSWYRSHFPLRDFDSYRKRIAQKRITGEASPYYIFHPYALRRIAETTHRVKLIAILRNPIDRALSHYQHEVSIGYEKLSFAEAILQESQRLATEQDTMKSDEHYYSFAHQHYSYLSRGLYENQLRGLWQAGFSKKQVLVLQSEEFFADSERGYSELLEFLELPAWKPSKFERLNLQHYDHMTADMREHLRLFFEPHNQRLYHLLGRDLNWR